MLSVIHCKQQDYEGLAFSSGKLEGPSGLIVADQFGCNESKVLVNSEVAAFSVGKLFRDLHHLVECLIQLLPLVLQTFANV